MMSSRFFLKALPFLFLVFMSSPATSSPLVNDLQPKIVTRDVNEDNGIGDQALVETVDASLSAQGFREREIWTDDHHHLPSTLTSTTSPNRDDLQQPDGSASLGSAPSASIPDVSLTSLSTSAVQTVTGTLSTTFPGSTVTSIATSGQTSTLPFPTSISAPTTTLTLIDTSTLSNVEPSRTNAITSLSVNNIFQSIATDGLPSQISTRGDHAVARLGIQPQQRRLQTNKFYANLFLGSQTAPVFTYPYSVAWCKGSGSIGSWGMAISHAERSQLAYADGRSGYDAGQWAYFVNPIGIQPIILSAVELSNGTSLTTDSLDAFSVNANLVAAGSSSPTVTFPLLQGMSMVTAIYRGATPLLQSSIGFQNMTYVGTLGNGATFKYRVLLADGTTWLVYISPSDAGFPANTLKLASVTAVQGLSGFSGTIQLAKVPTAAPTDAERAYDASAGAYPYSADISGTVTGTSGSYTLSWTKRGVTSQRLLMFALPHHMSSMSPSSLAGRTNVQLVTRTKGMATAILGDSWNLLEPNLPIDMAFAPWSPAKGSIRTVSAAAARAINAAAAAELSQNISAQTNVGSLYYDGKALAKFAAIVYATHDLAGNATLALTGLKLLEEALEVHIRNRMTWPVVYDTAWGGIVSSSTYTTQNSGMDFGNTYYNDHHYHYGYFVYVAAVVGYLDPGWLSDSGHRAWVNLLVRDFANPSKDDPLLPSWRTFDWYHGHSWAGGLFESYDGRNQESSSEDALASYAIKMWGQVSGDVNMQARGNLMLAIQARSLQSYYLYTSDNAVEPAQFIGNKAAGILFDNKIDHTTYFGDNAEYVEGIHMLPIMPFSTLIRTPTFVRQEWQAYNFSSAIAQVSGGWKGILMANYAIADPQAAYRFFSESFDPAFLDGGASQTWYLAWSAALAGF